VPAVVIEDASGFRGEADELFAPESEAALARIVEEAARRRIPLTVAGGRTGVTGGCVPEGGWAVSTERLRKLEIGKGEAVAGAGVTLHELHAAAVQSGQFYAPDPTETWASVGGAIATNASGSRSFRYGATRNHVLALRVVLADGSVREFQRGERIDFPVVPVRRPRTRKNTAGFALEAGMDWVDLFIGSEGTLGIVTEARLRLLPLPRHLLTGIVFFPDEEQALTAVESWRTIAGLRMLEYMDRGSLDLLRTRYPEIPRRAGACLLMEQELEDPRREEAESGMWIERLDDAGADLEQSWFAGGETDRERFRRFRHALPESVNETVRRNAFEKLGSDYAVPPEESRRMMGIYRERLDEDFAGRYVIFGHIGDAHVHVNLMPASAEEYERGKALLWELAAEAVRLGGTVSAEHGVGKRKSALLRLQFSAEEIEAMKAVKRRLDPAWLLGRGNVFGGEES
jgi:FAD/FMN-containing dehydrogenase